jgi:hypothetical protein
VPADNLTHTEELVAVYHQGINVTLNDRRRQTSPEYRLAGARPVGGGYCHERLLDSCAQPGAAWRRLLPDVWGRTPVRILIYFLRFF